MVRGTSDRMSHCPLACFIYCCQSYEWISVGCPFIEEVGAAILCLLPSRTFLELVQTLLHVYGLMSIPVEVWKGRAFFRSPYILMSFWNYFLDFILWVWKETMRIFSLKLSDFCIWVWKLWRLLLFSHVDGFSSLNKSKVCRSFKS